MTARRLVGPNERGGYRIEELRGNDRWVTVARYLDEHTAHAAWRAWPRVQPPAPVRDPWEEIGRFS